MDQLPTDVAEFLDGLTEPRQAEARALTALFVRATGFQPRLWPARIIGFGRYDYRYESGHSGSSLATGFSPRAAEISVYILPGYTDFGPILNRLGKHRKGKSCLYLRRLSDADPEVLEELIRAGLNDLRQRWTVLADAGPVAKLDKSGAV